MTSTEQVVVGVGLAFAGVLWLALGRRGPSSAPVTPPTEPVQPPAPPALPPTDRQPPATPPVRTFTDEQAARLELATFNSVDPVVVGDAVRALREGGIEPFGLRDYAKELIKMTANVKAEILDALKKATKTDISPLTVVALNLRQFYPQTWKQLFLVARFVKDGPSPALFTNVRTAAEGSGQVHGLPTVFEWIEAA